MWLTLSKSSQTFSVDLFNNYFGLERYMSGENELKAIETLSKRPQLLRRPTKINPYYGRGSVFVICLKFPFNLAISSVCSTVAFVLNRIWLNHFAAFFEVVSIQMTRQWQQVADQWTNQSPMLVPALNAPKMSAWDVYMCPNFQTHSIDDPDIKPFTPRQAVLQEQIDHALDHFYKELDQTRQSQWFFMRWPQNALGWIFTRSMERSAFKVAFANNPQRAMKQLKKSYRFDRIEKHIAILYRSLLNANQMVRNLDQIKFYNSRGDCRGGSEWFIRLLLKSGHHFHDPVQHILAVAKQFETGISGQGLVLQALVKCSNMLEQRIKEMHNHTISTFELDADRASALKKIETLPTGIYRVGVYQHSLVHIKLPNGEQYTWDPSYGLYLHTPQQLLDFVLKNYYVKENPGSHIYFEQYESSQPQKQSA